MSDFDGLRVDFAELYPGHLEAFEREVLSIGCEPVCVIGMGIFSSMAILGALQLALRHPGTIQTPEVRAKVLAIAEGIEEDLARWPAIAAVAAAGWNPVFDTQSEGEP